MISPHGGILKDLISRDKTRKEELLKLDLPCLVLNQRQLCDLELLLTGAFSPLEGFMTFKDYESVLHQSRLSNGLVWTIPITLDISKDTLASLAIQPTLPLEQDTVQVYLTDSFNNKLAVLTIQDVYKPDKSIEAVQVYGKDDQAHPGVYYLHNQSQEYYIGGSLQAIQTPPHYDFQQWRYTPSQLRSLFEQKGWEKIVAFQTRNPMHRAHRELTIRAARSQKCHVLIHPVVGMTKPGDVDHYTRVRVYQSILDMYSDGMAGLSLLPLAMRMAGPREAVWHAIIRKNYGCTHFIVGRDHAGPGKDSAGNDFYGPYDAQTLVERYRDEVGITVVPFKMVTYVPDLDAYLPVDEVPSGKETWNISGTELRRRLATGQPIPDWFTYPQIQTILRKVHPPRSLQGFLVVIVGEGNVEVAHALESVLNQSGQRPITLIPTEYKDSTHVSFLSTQVVKNGGVVIAPVEFQHQQLHEVVEDVKKVGSAFVVRIASATDKLEPLAHPTLTVDKSNQSVYEILHEVVLELEKEGYIGTR